MWVALQLRTGCALAGCDQKNARIQGLDPVPKACLDRRPELNLGRTAEDYPNRARERANAAAGPQWKTISDETPRP